MLDILRGLRFDDKEREAAFQKLYDKRQLPTDFILSAGEP
jgi:hypothetical protein